MGKRSTKRRPPPESPTCSCLVLCDDVVVSHGQDKHHLYGIIGALGVPSLPHIIGGFVAYARLSNVYEEQKVTVAFSHAEDDQLLWEFAAQLVNRDTPLAVHTLITRIPRFQIERAGRYVLAARHGGNLL